MTLEMLNYLIKIASINNSPSLNTHKHPDDEVSAFIASLSLKKESADILSKIKYRIDLLSVAKNDPLKAEQLLSTNLSAETSALPLMDFTNWPTVRYAVSGELKTPESGVYFQNISAAAATIRSAIAEAEQAKGTPVLHILEKILAFNSALPERYKAMANIQYS